MVEAVSVRDYKEVDLEGGTLLVSVPQAAVGGSLLTDFTLEQMEMDQIACVRSPFFPPLAMVRDGRARFPARVHASVARKLAVLRFEFVPPPELAGPVAEAILEWARDKSLGRVVILDAVIAMDDGGRGGPRLFYTTHSDEARKAAGQAGLEPLERGALAGLTATMLLEGRLRGMDTVAVLAAVRSPMDDARSVVAFAEVLGRLVDGFDVDATSLSESLEELEGALRTIRQDAEKALAQSRRQAPSPTPAYA